MENTIVARILKDGRVFFRIWKLFCGSFSKIYNFQKNWTNVKKILEEEFNIFGILKQLFKWVADR